MIIDINEVNDIKVNSECVFTSQLNLRCQKKKKKKMIPGILGGDPLSPYPMSDGMTSFRFSPTHILQILFKHLLLNDAMIK